MSSRLHTPKSTPLVGSISPYHTPAMIPSSEHKDPFNISNFKRSGGKKNKTMKKVTSSQRKTKIICTIGPKTRDVETLTKLMKAGMNVVRCNFSHGDHKYHSEVIANAREMMKRTKRLCAIMLDTKGPEIRTCMLKNGGEVELVKGQVFRLMTDTSILGDNTRVAVQYKNLPKVLELGNIVLIDDGLLSMRVEDILETEVVCRVLNTGLLGQKKGVNLPGVCVDLPAVTEKDIDDIKFGAEQNVDYIAASFVRNAAGVREIRKVLGKKGRNIRIISKIENQEGLENFDEILEESDGIMVARGDLGVEIPLEHVALAQKMMIRKCNLAGKIVVTATQMLDSMIYNPFPTRAEASDVANAVFDGTDCVMLSGETAKGDFPIKSVEIMAKICIEAEDNINYRSVFQILRNEMEYPVSISEAIASSAVKTAWDLKASLLVVFTESGSTARFVAKYRPPVPIICVTSNEQVCRQLLTSRGCIPALVTSTTGQASLLLRVLDFAKENKICKIGDIVVATSGAKEGVEGLTNNLKVVTIKY